MGSRVRIAAAACLVALGLLAGGAGASIAFADSPLPVDGSGHKHDSGEKPKSNPDEKKTPPSAGGKEEQPGTDPVDPKSEDDKKGAEDGKKTATRTTATTALGTRATATAATAAAMATPRAAAGVALLPPLRPRGPQRRRPKKSLRHRLRSLKNPASATTRVGITARPDGRGGRGHGIRVNRRDPAEVAAAAAPRCRPAVLVCRRRCSCRPS